MILATIERRRQFETTVQIQILNLVRLMINEQTDQSELTFHPKIKTAKRAINIRMLLTST